MNAPAGDALWLFDLGNTSLKGRWSRGAQAGEVLRLAWQTTDIAPQLSRSLAAWPAPARILVASVASAERAEALRRALGPRSAQSEWLTSPHQACGITSVYRIPARLGVDRFLAMAGTRAEAGGKPLVIVGCGTALTLDAVDADGLHREGLIVPSPDLMIRSLQGETAIGHTNPAAFGGAVESATDDTRSAIRVGCWRAAVALVASFHVRHQVSLDSAGLWLHGGGAVALKSAIDAYADVPAALFDGAVWRGLELWAASQPS